MSSRSLVDLRDPFRTKAGNWLVLCAQAGIDALVICTYRSGEEQDAEYAKGRTVKNPNGATASKPLGKIVTNARAGQSAHNHRLALDFVIMVNGKPDWSGKHPHWMRAIELAQQVGMESLANNPKFKELAHLQQPNWKDLAI